jgi:hypothetical protein
MTMEEIERTGEWSNEEYFDYMKETGNWVENEDLGHTGKPCDRCEHDELGSWKVEAFFNVVDVCTKSYTVVTEFEICLMCMFELYSATYPHGNEDEEN